MNSVLKKSLIVLLVVVMILPIMMPTISLATSDGDIVDETGSAEEETSPEDTSVDVPEVTPEPEISEEPSTEPEEVDDSDEPKDDSAVSETPVEEDSSVVEEKVEVMQAPLMMQQPAIMSAAPQQLTSNQVLPNGTYYIQMSTTSSSAVEVANAGLVKNTNVQFGANYGQLNQRFNVTYVDGYYKIVAVHSSMALTVVTGGTNVLQAKYSGASSQQWVLQPAQNDSFKIISNYNQMALEVNRSNIQVNKSVIADTQRFVFIPVEPVTHVKTIDDGIYSINLNANPNVCLEVANANTLKNANIQLGTNYRQLNQKFNIKHLGDGYYSIAPIHTNMPMTASSNGLILGTNVLQGTANGSAAQQWIIREVESGTGVYNIISRYNELALDTARSGISNGVNVHLFADSNRNTQRFTFTKIESVIPTQTLEDGVYNIHLNANPNMVLEIANGSKLKNSNIQIGTNYNLLNQRFAVTHIGDGYYTITSTYSGFTLTASNSSLLAGTNVLVGTSMKVPAQQWIIKEVEPDTGVYSIISRCNELALDTYKSGTSNGSNIQLYTNANKNTQKFTFTKVEPIETSSALPNGVYAITSATSANFVLDIAGASKANRANLQLYRNVYEAQQKFEVSNLGNGYYRIRPMHSGKSLEVSGGSVLPFANVYQTTTSNTIAQQWIIKDAGDGYYYIISRCSELYLNVDGNTARNGRNIYVYPPTGAAGQKFRFVKAGTRKGIDVSEWQGNIDWYKVKKSGAVDFAIIRAGYRGWGTEGTLVTDKQFAANVAGAKAYGIDIGLYFFTQAVTEKEAIEEANYVISLVKKYNVPLNYPIFIDTETSSAPSVGKVGRADTLSVARRTAVCKAFVNTLESAGYRAGIYASRNWFYDNLDESQLTAGDIWVAHYTYNGAQTNYKNRYNMWQYTSSGRVSGINGNVDLNVAYY